MRGLHVDFRSRFFHDRTVIYRLIPKNPRPEQLVLSFGWGWRVFFGAVAALLAYGMLQDRVFGALGLIFTAILILAALYHDRWEFDRETGAITHSSGLLPVHRTRRYPLNDLREVLTRGRAPSNEGASAPEGMLGRGPHRGPPRGLNRGFTRLWLRFEEAGDVDVQMDSNRHQNAMQNLAMEIARFCDVPYRDTEGE